jgi:hypothetical protein
MVELGLAFAQYRSQRLKSALEHCAWDENLLDLWLSPDQISTHRPDPGLAVAASAEAVQAISTIGDVSRVRKSRAPALPDSLVVIVLYDTSLRAQRPYPERSNCPVNRAEVTGLKGI